MQNMGIATYSFLSTKIWKCFDLSNPTPEPLNDIIWDEFDRADQNYLSINYPKMEMKNAFFADDLTFWEGLVEELQTLDSNVCNVAKRFAGLPMFLYYALYC